MNLFVLEKQLEIFIPTYNRKPHITRTLTQLTAPDSPVKNCSITVLDNASEDGSSEVIAEFSAKFNNVTHIRHPKNIGGNANITRSYELARKPYVWVVCDDDQLNFTEWATVEKLLLAQPPAIVIANYAHPQQGVAHLFRQLAFVPAAIYRTDLITSDTLLNMYNNIAYMFPQLALAAAAINTGHPIPILSKPLVVMQLNSMDDSYQRGFTNTLPIHPVLREMNWMMGYLITTHLLADKHLIRQCGWLARVEDESFYNYCGRFMEKGSGLFYTYVYGVHYHSGLVKIVFALLAWPAFICSFYTDNKGVYIRLFGKLKTRIWKFRTKKA